MIKAGQIVWYRWKLEDGKKEGPSFPALVYKTYGEESCVVGLYVYSDVGIIHLRRVGYSQTTEECWRFDE